MTTKANTFEGGTDTTALSAANTGGTSGDAISGPPTGTAPTFATAAAMHGFLGMSASAASGTASAVNWAGFSSTNMALRFYYKHRTPTANTQILQVRTGAGQAMGMAVQTGNTIITQNSAGTGISGSTSSALTSGTWYRIEIQVFSNASTGTVSYQIYAGDSLTVFSFHDGTSVNTRGGNLTDFNLGKWTTTTDTGTWLFDSVKATDGTLTAIGPYLNALVIRRRNPQLTLR